MVALRGGTAPAYNASRGIEAGKLADTIRKATQQQWVTAVKHHRVSQADPNLLLGSIADSAKRDALILGLCGSGCLTAEFNLAQSAWQITGLQVHNIPRDRNIFAQEVEAITAAFEALPLVSPSEQAFMVPKGKFPYFARLILPSNQTILKGESRNALSKKLALAILSQKNATLHVVDGISQTGVKNTFSVPALAQTVGFAREDGEAVLSGLKSNALVMPSRVTVDRDTYVFGDLEGPDTWAGLATVVKDAGTRVLANNIRDAFLGSRGSSVMGRLTKQLGAFGSLSKQKVANTFLTKIGMSKDITVGTPIPSVEVIMQAIRDTEAELSARP